MSEPPRTAAVVLIGNELLSGKVEDANARYLVAELRALGVTLRRVLVIPDELDEIAAAVGAAAAAHDVVFTSGGVGPTHDDVTIAGVARAFGLAVARHPDLEAMLRRHYAPEIADAALRMADLPVGAELVGGEGLTWPVTRVRNVYVLPGVPEIFRRKFEAIKGRFRQAPFALRSVYTRADEAALAPLLDRVVAEFAQVQLGSYPRHDGAAWSVRLTLEGKDADAVARATERLVGLLPDGALIRVE